MTIVYISNYFNHHQQPVSDEFYRQTDGHYYFIETTPIPEFRVELGYKKIERPYVIAYKGNEDFVNGIVLEADVVIHGEAPTGMIRERVRKGKLTFHDNERRYKSWIKYLKWPIYTYNSLTINKCYLLCASAYASRDFALSGMKLDKCFKWGYFTKEPNFDSNKELTKPESDDMIHIMWCGRMIGLKHPELPIKLAARLKQKGYRFVVDMFGNGTESDNIKALANKMEVDDVVKFHGARPNDEILTEMRNHDIFLFTSDQNEGWGAVLNEAMWNGCAVVASHSIGATPYLIQDGVNGMIFKSEDIDSLYKKVAALLNDKSSRESMGKEAYATMKNVWCAQNACRNFMLLCDALLKGDKNPVETGPCSMAPELNHR